MVVPYESAHLHLKWKFFAFPEKCNKIFTLFNTDKSVIKCIECGSRIGSTPQSMRGKRFAIYGTEQYLLCLLAQNRKTLILCQYSIFDAPLCPYRTPNNQPSCTPSEWSGNLNGTCWQICPALNFNPPHSTRSTAADRSNDSYLPGEITGENI